MQSVQCHKMWCPTPPKKQTPFLYDACRGKYQREFTCCFDFFYEWAGQINTFHLEAVCADVPSSRAGCRCQAGVWSRMCCPWLALMSTSHVSRWWGGAMGRTLGHGRQRSWMRAWSFHLPSTGRQNGEEMSILKVGMFWIEWLQDKGNVTGHYYSLKEFWLWAKCCPTRPLIHIVTAAELMPRNIYFWNFCFTSIIHFNVLSSS